MSKKKNTKSLKVKYQPVKSKTTIQESFNKFFEFRYLSRVIGILFFIILLIVSFLYHKVGDYGIETDFFWGYVPQAKAFINGGLVIDPFRGPLYPIVLGLVTLVTGNYFYSGMLIGILSAAIILVVTFELLSRIFSPAISLFVTLIVAANSIFVQYSYSAGTDMFFNVLAVTTLYFFFKEKDLRYKNLIIAAFFAGLSYLTRYNGVFLLGFIFIILFVNYWNIDWKKRLITSAVFLGIFLVTFSPWGIYCLIEKGSFFYNENYKNIAYELFGKGSVSWDQFWFKESSNYKSMIDVLTRDIPLFISTVIGNVGEHFVLDMERLTGWFVGVIVIVGLALLIVSNPLKKLKTRETGYYLSNLFFFGLLLLVFYSERFSLFLLPFYAIVAVQPFFSDKFGFMKRIPRMFAYLIAIFLVVVTLTESISFNGSRIDSGPNELLNLREWYETNIPENERGSKIAARKAHVAYYLDMEFSLLPLAENYNELLEKLKENNVDYLYFSPIEAAMRGEFQSLLDPKSAHPGLEAVVYFNNPPSVLYRIIKD
jgi:hypothetical protein